MSSCSKHSHHHYTVIIATSLTILGRILLLTFSYNTDVHLIFLFSLNLFFSPTFSIAEVNCWFIYIHVNQCLGNILNVFHKKFIDHILKCYNNMKKILTHILHFLRNWSKSKQTLTLMERSEKKIQTPLKVQDRKILDTLR